MSIIADTDENGDPFDVWVVKRSFVLLAPVCRLGFFASAAFLIVADPLYFALHLWSQAIPQGYLVAWHVAMMVMFGGFLLTIRRVDSHEARNRTLKAFFAATTLLFVWFGVVSWIGTGDVSIVAIATIVIAAVLNFPGNFRRILYCIQALALCLALSLLDGSGRFLGQMHFANVILLAVVAYVIDGYMLRNALDLFKEKCLVAAERNRADTVLYNALPLDIANELKTHGKVKAQSHPGMAVLFADIVGFTQFAAERAPDQVLEALSGIFSEMDALLDANQVEKIKTIGDAYMAVSKTQPAAIASLALAMLQLMQQHNARNDFQFSLRIGLHCGPTIAGVIGHKRFLYDVWGDAVNIASRMESSGTPGKIHVSEALYLTLQDHFDFEERGVTEIKGKGPMRTYFLVSARST